MTDLSKLPKRRRAMELFCADLPLVMDRAGRLGLLKTMHALHEAVRVSGYELAEHLSPTAEKGE